MGKSTAIACEPGTGDSEAVEVCVCGKPVKVQIMKNSGFCSERCRKKAKGDTSSVGSYMFVSNDERAKLLKKRNG